MPSISNLARMGTDRTCGASTKPGCVSNEAYDSVGEVWADVLDIVAQAKGTRTSGTSPRSST